MFFLLGHGFSHRSFEKADDFFLPAVVVGDEADLRLVSHLTPMAHENLQLLVVGEPHVGDGDVDLDFHVDEVGDKHGDLVGDLLEEELSAHFNNPPAAGPIMREDVILERMGDVLVEVVEGKLVLVYLDEVHDVWALYEFCLFYHFILLLAQTLQAAEVLNVLDPYDVPLLRCLVERVFPFAHLDYRLDH
jgi:hypothetical protein